MWDWYQLFNLDEWLETGLISRKLTLFLEGRGSKDVLITQGNLTSIQVDDLFLPLRFRDQNPYAESGTGVWIDSENNVWLGYEAAQ